MRHDPTGPRCRSRSRNAPRRAIFRAGVVRRIRWTLALGLVVIAAQACRDAVAGPPLAGGRETEEALVAAVLESLARKDGGALRSFLVSREEYESLLWPEMPDSTYTPFDFVWSLADANNRKGIREALHEYGGMSLEFVSITFTEEPERYQNFTIHPGAEVKVRRTDTGQEGILPSFDVLVEYGGVWKLLNLDEI